MKESKEMLTLRRMAWARAKGELRSILETYWSEYSTNGKELDTEFKDVNERIINFIKDFEDNW